MICPKCGKDNKDSKFDYCLSCGTYFNNAQVESVNTDCSYKPNTWTMLIKGIIIADLFFILALIILGIIQHPLMNFTSEDIGFASVPKSWSALFIDIIYIILFFLVSEGAQVLTIILVILGLGYVFFKLFKVVFKIDLANLITTKFKTNNIFKIILIFLIVGVLIFNEASPINLIIEGYQQQHKYDSYKKENIKFNYSNILNNEDIKIDPVNIRFYEDEATLNLRVTNKSSKYYKIGIKNSKVNNASSYIYSNGANWVYPNDSSNILLDIKYYELEQKSIKSINTISTDINVYIYDQPSTSDNYGTMDNTYELKTYNNVVINIPSNIK